MQLVLILTLAVAIFVALALAQGICSTPKGTCNRHGECNITVDGEYECICDSAYGGPSCQYKRRKQVGEFLLAFFIGETGAGYFYMGRTALGVGMLILLCGACIVTCIGGCIAMANREIGMACCATLGIIGGISGFAIFGWWLATWIIAIQNNLHDNHGLDAQSW